MSSVKYSLVFARAIASTLLILTFFVSGCAQKKILDDNQGLIDLSEKSVALFSVKISNQKDPNNQLGLRGTMICPEKETCITRPYYHEAGDPYKSEKNKYNEYLLSFDLKPGTHNIYELLTIASWALGTGVNVPINLEAVIKPNSVIYLGHMDVVVREKQNENEESAATFPLLGAAILGFASGTFDIIVEDRYDKDIMIYASKYPALQNVKVEKSILSQWIRPENRKDR